VSRTEVTTRPGEHAYAYWTLRVMESGLLLTALVGIGLFAYSLVDILRIETAAVPTTAMPPSAWPGVFIFFGSMVLLQVVRIVLQRYRRDDGTPRGDARGRAAQATAEILASVPDDTGDITAPAEAQTEG
jgi:hypothetical protein